MSQPASFPINGLYALRGAVLAQQLGVFADYHAASVAAIARELRFAELAERIDDAAIKLELRAATEHAAQRGAFGVPTFFVDEEMFWGHDRIDYVRRALA